MAMVLRLETTLSLKGGSGFSGWAFRGKLSLSSSPNNDRRITTDHLNLIVANVVRFVTVVNVTCWFELYPFCVGGGRHKTAWVGYKAIKIEFVANVAVDVVDAVEKSPFL